MRFVRAHEFDVHRGTCVEVIRCPVCCEGNNVNREREELAIERYMARWRTEHDRFKNNTPDQLRIATAPRETREGGAQ